MPARPQTISFLTSGCVIATLAWPGLSQWDAFAFAASAAMIGLGLLYPWALSRELADSGNHENNARRDMHDIDVGPATTALLF